MIATLIEKYFKRILINNGPNIIVEPNAVKNFAATNPLFLLEAFFSDNEVEMGRKEENPKPTIPTASNSAMAFQVKANNINAVI